MSDADYQSDVIVWQEPKHVGYYYSCLTAAVASVRHALQSEEAVAIHGYENLKVETDYPIAEQAYPYIRVGYSNDGWQPFAPNEWFQIEDKNNPGTYVDMACYVYTGRITIDVYALSPVESALLADAIIAILEVDDTFKKTLISNPYINIAPNTKTMRNTASNDSLGTPWDADQVTVFKQFSFDVRCEFYYINPFKPEFIEKIKLSVLVDTDKLEYIIKGNDDESSVTYITPGA